MKIEKLLLFVLVASAVAALVAILLRKNTENTKIDPQPDKVVNQSWTQEFSVPQKVLMGDQVQLKIGSSVWIPNPFLAKHSEAEREGRLAIPIDGMELFEHGIYDGGDMDKSENFQYIKGSGMHEANWGGVIDLWSPEGMKTQWSGPGTSITQLIHDPNAPYSMAQSNKRVEHGFTFKNKVLHSLFDLVIQENPIFQNFEPNKNTINAQKFKYDVYATTDSDEEASDDEGAF